MTDADPARAVAEASRKAVRAKDKDAWLALFAEDGWVEDPVGPSGFDPDGRGHHGRDEIAAFWDKAIALADTIEFDYTDSFACGREVAYTGAIRTTVAGTRIDAEGVFVYRVDPEGRLMSLRAFWEVDRAMATARTIAPQ
ncbi:nuclear transport factor 2 family protein [Tsukamurella sp. 8F]|uniref:nuclear transport factor 2 family protein n=1 Tax=unclassified Tsukamurella TaxID=2633480 RepID=UPI0023B97469|nr:MULTISPECIES: nuclear transport factor 2 family protein [unclassified Tsukamurella]MDF0530707.1 nuclear transport factor 2 family protein [Tsukamurella sp. 8J]MDF0587908.1 nuclear transport factor 2 family protein [Tsukamurella sp. 8F]